MNTEFVTQHAPNLALPPSNKGQWVTPEPQAGLTAPENLYGADGMPLNYIQDQGGPRQFFAPTPTGTPQVSAPVAGIRGRASPAPTPLRGLSAPEGSPFDIPLAPVAGLRGRSDEGAAPQNLMQRNPSRSPETAPQPRSYNGPRARAPIPVGTSNEVEQSIAAGLRDGRIDPVTPDMIRQRVTNPDEVTLEDILRSLNFDFSGLPGPRRRFDSPNQTPRNSNVIRLPDDQPLNTVDPRADFGASGRVQRTSARAPGAPNQWAGRAEEVATTLRNGLNGRGVRVTSVTRTGNARSGGHPEGNSIDIDPSQLQLAQEIISGQYPDMPVEYIFIRRGQDLGNGVRATGDHYHIDIGPAAGNRRANR